MSVVVETGSGLGLDVIVRVRVRFMIPVGFPQHLFHDFSFWMVYESFGERLFVCTIEHRTILLRSSRFFVLQQRPCFVHASKSIYIVRLRVSLFVWDRCGDTGSVEVET